MYKEKIAAELRAAEEIRAKGENLTAEDMDKIEAHLKKAEEYKELQQKAADQEARLAAFGGERKIHSEPGSHNVEVKDPEWMKDPKKGFKTPREFFGAIMDKVKKGISNDRLDFLATQGSDENKTSSDPLGGFLVPIGFSPELLQLKVENDPTLNLTRKIPMGNSEVKIPARVDEDHSTSVAGGLTVARKEEAVNGASSRMKFSQVKLAAHTLFGAAFITEELMSDSPITVAALLEEGFSEAFTDKLLDEKINGSGVGEYEGVTNSPAFISQAKESAQSADTIIIENILKMRSRCWGYQNAIWMANHDTYPQLAQLNAGTDIQALVWQPSAAVDRPDLLLGRPIHFTEYTETLGDANDIILINWREYLEGTYQRMKMAESVHVRFLANENTFKFYLRNDGRGWWKAALTPRKSAITMSPFVGLAAR